MLCLQKCCLLIELKYMSCVTSSKTKSMYFHVTSSKTKSTYFHVTSSKTKSMYFHVTSSKQKVCISMLRLLKQKVCISMLSKARECHQQFHFFLNLWVYGTSLASCKIFRKSANSFWHSYFAFWLALFDEFCANELIPSLFRNWKFR